MQKVFVAPHHAEAHLVTGLLRSHGIAAEVRGEALFTTVEAASVMPGAAPEVWVSNSGQAQEALELVRCFSTGGTLPGSSGPTWLCPACGETLEAQFTECWNCGAAKPSPTPRPD